MSSTALALKQDRPDQSIDATFRIAKAFAASGYFKDARDEAQAVVRILAGYELGFGPFASMQGVYIIEGKPTIAAGLMASAVKRSGRYNYRVRSHTDQECSIEFFEGRDSLGVSSFTMKDAERAGLIGKGPWKQYPRNMLFARAMSNGVKFHCPDIFAGPVYTPEELGQEVNEDGELLRPPAPAIRMVDPLTAEVSLPAESRSPAVIFAVAPGGEPVALDEAALPLNAYADRLRLIAAKGPNKRDASKDDWDWFSALPAKLEAESERLGLPLPDRGEVKTWQQGLEWAARALDALRPF